MPSPRWLPAIIASIHAHAAAGSVRITDKAYDEMDQLGVDTMDVCETLAGLAARDFYERVVSNVPPYGYLYAFKPDLDGLTLYVKVALRATCLVVSFHGDDLYGDQDQD